MHLFAIPVERWFYRHIMDGYETTATLKLSVLIFDCELLSLVVEVTRQTNINPSTCVKVAAAERRFSLYTELSVLV